MTEWFSQFSPVVQALFGTLFTWGVTALGAALVFFFKSINKTVLNAMLGFAAGVMIAASFWSLLSPAIEMAESLGQTAWIILLKLKRKLRNTPVWGLTHCRFVWQKHILVSVMTRN